jgi:ATP-dependent Lon protease
VLPIGGLKEKSVAAHRNKVSDVIIPYGNARDLDELPEEVREGVRFHPVKTMDEVLAIAMRGDSLAKAAEKREARIARRSRARAEGAQDTVTAH